MSAATQYVVGVGLAINLAVFATFLTAWVRDAYRQRKARKALTAASLDHALTVRRLDAARAEGRDVIDATVLPLSKSPAAVRIRNRITDNEVARFRRELDQWGREA